VIEESAEERLAQLEKAMARSLELLGLGEMQEARCELERALAPAGSSDVPPLVPGGSSDVPPLAEFSEGVSDQELDHAFEAASPETDQMLDADRVAQVAMRQADEALGEDLAPHEVGTAFATRTMADLLEDQGDPEGAARIRASLEDAAELPPPDRPVSEGWSGGRPRRQQVIATLERWLDNLRGGIRA
jgi:hypothetical protein